ncbi:NADH-quinone oxidoreductase subunit NuoG [soil metagenome]
MTVMTGHDYRKFRYKKRTYTNQYLGPFIHHEMNRCIQCYRCVRYYRDYAGGDDLNVFAAHDHVYFGREKDGILQSPFSGNLSEICPTGVFTDKTLKEHYTRKWDLTMAPSVCQHCSVGCNIIAGERYGKVRCVLNRYNGEVNGYFLCDRGRFGYEFVNSENRIRQPLIRGRESEAVSEPELMNHLKPILKEHELIGVGSPRASLESNFALRDLVGADNFFIGINETEAILTRRVVRALQSGAVQSASLKDIEEADAVLILGEDIWNTAPMMGLAVRQAVMKTAANDSLQNVSIPAWHDAAVKELVQEEKGFLASISITVSPLDEIASLKLIAAPDDIARLGLAIAHQLNNSLPEVPGADDAMLEQASAIAKELKKAKNPVIISGISSRKDTVVHAAFNIAAALGSPEKQAGLAYALPENNSMGLALMQSYSIEKVIDRLRRDKDVTAIVLETDLYRFMPSLAADNLFTVCKNVIVLDSLNNPTTEKANIVIPAATFAEGDGTIVNYEGRAQRYYQVFMPEQSSIQESWKWLSKMKQEKMQLSERHDPSLEEFLEKLEKALPNFSGITKVAPKDTFTIHGQKIPREPHRYSGRTAMHANLDVSEPKPLFDNDSPLTYTMEGFNGIPPSSLTPFFWSPGWNSVQAVTKYQNEPGGSMKDGDPGIKLFTKKWASPEYYKSIPEPFAPRQQKWIVLPQYDVLGSGELSIYTNAINELSPKPYVFLSEKDAKILGVNNDDILKIKESKNEYRLPVKIKKELKDGLILVSAGLRGVDGIHWGEWVKLELEKKNG